MIRRTIVVAALAVTSVASFAQAQDPRDLETRTFKLRNMKPEDAAKLLSPYVLAPGGGVFEAGSIGSITVRETATNLKMIDSLLKLHDRARAVVSMRFKLIAAHDSSFRDPAINDIDAELRKLFRFGGYELIGEGTMLTEEFTEFMTTLSTKPKRGPSGELYSEGFRIMGFMEGVAGEGAERSVRASITLQSERNDSDILRTGLTLPVGQTVILGSARPTYTIGTRGALILVVQPEIPTAR